MLDITPPATTTAEEDRKTAGQRHINVMWESTQRNTAHIVTLATATACCYLIWKQDIGLATPAFVFLSNICTQVLTTYFQRTNHTKIGGISGTDSR